MVLKTLQGPQPPPLGCGSAPLCTPMMNTTCECLEIVNIFIELCITILKNHVCWRDCRCEYLELWIFQRVVDNNVYQRCAFKYALAMSTHHEKLPLS